jgi:hypothetical protein
LQEIASNPFECGGMKWSARHQSWYCNKLGVTTRTLQRMISKPPFASEQSLVGGVKLSILRLLAEGEAPKKTPKHLARIMRKIWLEKTGRTSLSPREYGCLIWLAQLWPEGCQIDIFKAALADWPAYMVGVKAVLEEMKSNGEPITVRFYKYASIVVMRRFPEVGVEVYGIKLQQAEKPLPPALHVAYMGQHIGGSNPKLSAIEIGPADKTKPTNGQT